MKKIMCVIGLALAVSIAKGQTSDSVKSANTGFVDKVIAHEGKLILGGYGEVHYNQPLKKETKTNGKLDVTRMVMLLGYNFNRSTQFVSEVEFEHVNELYVEQAYLQHKINKYINLNGGLMLIPMGIINEYHEPTTFNGVGRPDIDSKISTTTWREIGAGVSGAIAEASLKYQIYVVNGFTSYNDRVTKNGETLNGEKGLRNGRQKGINTHISYPNFTGRVEYFGIKGLTVGVSGYSGKTQTTLLEKGVKTSDELAKARVDSSVVGITMVGADARFSIGGLETRGQFYYTMLSNTEAYNRFVAPHKKSNDLGSTMMGYYAEVGYNILKHVSSTEKKLVPFVRYENINTHASTAGTLAKNKAYNTTIITSGISFHLTKGAVVKADIQLRNSEANKTFNKVFNAGVGVSF